MGADPRKLQILKIINKINKDEGARHRPTTTIPAAGRTSGECHEVADYIKNTMVNKMDKTSDRRLGNAGPSPMKLGPQKPGGP